MNKKISISGFTLVEVMIAAAVLGGLVLFGMQFMKSQTKSTAKNAFDSEMLLITNEINGILSDPAKCLNSFGGMNALSTTTGINSINTNRYYSLVSGSAPANGYGNANVDIESYALNATPAEVASRNSFLIINYRKKNILKGSSGTTTVPKKINLYVEVDASNNITKCRSLSSASTDIWTRGDGSNIFYTGGNVGIGTSAPVTALEVQGGIKFGDQTQVTSCSASEEGIQRYNSVSKKMEFCNGTAWVGLGGTLDYSQTITVVAPNAWNSVSGEKTANCPAGYVLTGVTWQQIPSNVDDEHVNAICTKLAN